MKVRKKQGLEFSLAIVLAGCGGPVSRYQINPETHAVTQLAVKSGIIFLKNELTQDRRNYTVPETGEKFRIVALSQSEYAEKLGHTNEHSRILIGTLSTVRTIVEYKTQYNEAAPVPESRIENSDPHTPVYLISDMQFPHQFALGVSLQNSTQIEDSSNDRSVAYDLQDYCKEAQIPETIQKFGDDGITGFPSQKISCDVHQYCIVIRTVEGKPQQEGKPLNDVLVGLRGNCAERGVAFNQQGNFQNTSHVNLFKVQLDDGVGVSQKEIQFENAL